MDRSTGSDLGSTSRSLKLAKVRSCWMQPHPGGRVFRQGECGSLAQLRLPPPPRRPNCPRAEPFDAHARTILTGRILNPARNQMSSTANIGAQAHFIYPILIPDTSHISLSLLGLSFSFKVFYYETSSSMKKVRFECINSAERLNYSSQLFAFP
jgi:hypothetical protein